AALVALGACTRIVHTTTGGTGSGGGGGPPNGPAAHIQILWLLNLPRSAINLVDSYAALHAGLIAALSAAKISVDPTAVARVYGGPGLLWGRSDRVQPMKDLATTLREAADSGKYELPAAGTAEQANLAALGAMLPTLTVPPALVGGQ